MILERLKQAVKEKAFEKGLWMGTAANGQEITELIAKVKPRANRTVLKRFGPASDGGYLMPDDLDGICACISPGVARECGFDLDLANRGIDIYMADASVDCPPIEHPRFHFTKVFLDSYISDTTTTIDDLCRSIPASPGGDDLILEMDIEGAEYRVIGSMSDALLRRFRIMVVEFHHLEQLFDGLCVNHIKSTFEKMTRYHDVVHLHPNNYYTPVRRGKFSVPRIMEFTFYRRDRACPGDNAIAEFPHRLDVDNVPGNPSVVLPPCWR